MPLPLGSDLSPSVAALKDRLLGHIATALQSQSPQAAVRVACSGGLDSVLLLWAAATVAPRRVRALHVQHGLNPDAERWASWLASLCRDWAVTLDIEHVHPDPGSNLEARARAARYAAFERHLNPADLLLLAHHRDDQLETLLLRLTRGAGLDGLSGMPKQRTLGQGTLIRPWLGEPREVLVQLGRALDLAWIEDPANQDRQHDRNFIRHDVMPLLRQRWPGVAQGLSHSLEHLQVAGGRLESLDAERLHALRGPHGSLELAGLRALPAQAERLSVLRLWLQRQGAGAIGFRQLEHLYTDVVAARADARGEVRLGTLTVRRHDDRLYLVAALPALPEQPVLLHGDARQGFKGGHDSLGTLALQPQLGAGLDARRLGQCTLTLAWRQGGERLHPAGRQGSRDLKRLLQELGIPPWRRAHVPLLCADGELVAVADRVLDRDWCADATSSGLVPQWQPPAHFWPETA